jgi:DNA ligase-1
MFRPMLAAKVENPSTLRYPLLASPKLDGIRAVVRNGAVLSRTQKPIPNRRIQDLFGKYEGYDGELIVGDPRDPHVFRTTTSAVMSQDGEPDVQFYAFDFINRPDLPFHQRLGLLREDRKVVVVTHHHVLNDSELLQTQDTFIRRGFEGTMLRAPNGLYKQGRSTLNEGWLLKFKQFADSEAAIIGVVEQMHNANEATVDERGYTKRSSHQENKVPTGKLGALSVRDLIAGVEFEIGTGFTDSDRVLLWAQRATLPGRLVKYSYFPSGSKEKPRFPVFQGFRDQLDMGV